MTHAFDFFQERRLSVGKIDNNKQMKRESLLDSAFSLFIDNGFNKTSISDIVNNAGVAKGTFYLYFKDKYDIRNHLIAHKASQIFQAAYADLLRHPDIQDFEEQVLFITDNILDQFAANHSLVTLISKHLSWGFFKNSLTFSPFSDAPAIYTIYESLLSHAAYTYRSPELMFYMILELVSGTSYNAILYQQPIPLEDLKPELYDAIRGIFKQFRIRKKRNVTESTEKWQIGVIDFWNDERINSISPEKRKLYLQDPIHPMKAGYAEWLVPVMEQRIAEYMETQVS